MRSMTSLKQHGILDRYGRVENRNRLVGEIGRSGKRTVNGYLVIADFVPRGVAIGEVAPRTHLAIMNRHVFHLHKKAISDVDKSAGGVEPINSHSIPIVNSVVRGRPNARLRCGCLNSIDSGPTQISDVSINRVSCKVANTITNPQIWFGGRRNKSAKL